MTTHVSEATILLVYWRIHAKVEIVVIFLKLLRLVRNSMVAIIVRVIAISLVLGKLLVSAIFAAQEGVNKELNLLSVCAQWSKQVVNLQ